MKKIILLFAILFSFSCFAQNGTTTVYSRTDIPSEWSTFKTGMTVSSGICLLGCGILAAAATAKVDTPEEIQSHRKANQAGFIILGAGFAGIIITNLSFIPAKKVSVTSSAYGIGLRYRL